MSLVKQFEQDCVSRILAARMEEREQPTPPAPLLPPASFFLMGMSFGVIAARVACTCGLFS
jgi:hypothetical protein